MASPRIDETAWRAARGRTAPAVVVLCVSAGVLCAAGAGRTASHVVLSDQEASTPPQSAAPRSPGAAAAALPLFRVVLSDGSAIVSYGEWARVNDRIVFTMPIGEVTADPFLQLVSLPSNAVDWAATERYAWGVRYAHYLATRAESDFAAFSGRIAELLKEVSLASEPARRLDLAERARRELSAWPREHFGYRANDLREIEEMLDATVSELRAAAGVRAFDLELVAGVEPPAMPLLPAPSAAQTIDQALAVARLSDVTVERQSLLSAVVTAIDGGRAGDARGWLGLARGEALAALNAERAADEAYGKLARESVAAAAWRASRGDVTGVESIEERVTREDGRLGRRRRDQVTALLATLDTHLDSARRLRLLRDHWAVMRPLYRAYARDIDPVVDRLLRRRPFLGAIRSEAGPGPGTLATLVRRLRLIVRDLGAIPAPADLETVHAQFRSAAELALHAVEARQQAVYTADRQRSRDAAAAAAGALMLLDRARSELAVALRRPELG